jgi:hypothetical protein
MTFLWKSLALAAGLSLVLGGFAAADEHPAEHPTARKDSEHPAEHPKETKPVASPVTKEDMAAAVRNHVKRKTRKGWMTLRDSATKQLLKLKLVKVHDDKLSKVGEDTYFACADFKASNGKTYDLDIFMKGKDAKGLAFTEVTVHKENGKERYTWKEEDGQWMKTPLAETKGEEHPAGEHPQEHPSK